MKSRKYFILISLIVLGTLIAIISCDNRTLEPESYILTNIRAVPSTIYADNNPETYSEVSVTVLNEELYPVSGEIVKFSTNFGDIESNIETNNAGIATAKFSDIGEIGDATISATINGSFLSTQVSIVEPPAFHIASMNANPDSIYADNGLTYSEISVVVRDEDNFAVTNEYVQFRTSLGNILYNILTDSTGVATSTFWDDGIAGTAVIDAFVGDVSSTVTVLIKEEPEIDSLVIEGASILKVAKTTLIRATVSNSIGYVPDGTLVVFETDRGFFQATDGTDLGSITQIATSNSIAKVIFNSSTETGLAHITAKISGLETVHIIDIQPGIATQIDLTATPDEIQVNSGENAVISAALKDSYNNPVLAGIGVNFTTSLGNITSFSITDSNGVATSTFYPGVEAGIAEIEAVSDSASATTAVTVFSDGVYSIEFAFPGQVDINIQGTGGQESYEFVVNLYDSNGNMIDGTETVWFKFMNGPAGANINNTVFLPLSHPSPDSLSVESDDGQAIVSVSSGTVSGPIALKAFVYTETAAGDPLIIAATKSNIVIHAGPPDSIELTLDDIDSGVNMGAGIWQIECASIISDQWGNPVDYGTAVYFSLPQDPSWATIEAEAYVQNQNASGDSLEGVAYTLLNYEGVHTNDNLLIKVEVSGEQIYADSTWTTMPIQFAQIDIVATPSHLDWDVAHNTQPILYTIVRVLVTDGQNNPINNQIIYFTSDYGFPLPGIAFPNDPYLGLTGEDPNQPDGLLFKEFGFYKYECNPPTITGPGVTVVTIEALIMGTDVMAQTAVTLRRYID